LREATVRSKPEPPPVLLALALPQPDVVQPALGPQIDVAQLGLVGQAGEGVGDHAVPGGGVGQADVGRAVAVDVLADEAAVAVEAAVAQPAAQVEPPAADRPAPVEPGLQDRGGGLLAGLGDGVVLFQADRRQGDAQRSAGVAHRLVAGDHAQGLGVGSLGVAVLAADQGVDLLHPDAVGSVAVADVGTVGGGRRDLLLHGLQGREQALALAGQHLVVQVEEAVAAALVQEGAGDVGVSDRAAKTAS
jgi:hypothetical protein